MKSDTDSSGGGYLPALRWHFLSPAYDLAVRLTSRDTLAKKRLIQHAAVGPDEIAVDLGCGTGSLLVAMQRSGARELIGVDRDLAVLGQAVAKLGDRPQEVSLCQLDARHLALAGSSVDVVVSSLFFHHLVCDVKETVLAEVRRILKPGARLVVADWGPPRSRATRAGAAFIRAFDGAEPTRDNLAGRLGSLISEAGFSDVSTGERINAPLGVIDIITACVPMADSDEV
jgi:ubiquinone/menaquinone biosynthesis C-methylase UbiE